MLPNTRDPSDYYSVSNVSRWQQLRALMLELDQAERPDFRSQYLLNGYVSPWDGEWFHHFGEGGFKYLEWIELRGRSLLEPHVFGGIVDVQFVGELRHDTLRLYGYVERGVAACKLVRS